jgi:intracellular multiplication protein IcmS
MELTKYFCKLASTMNVSFVLYGKSISYEEVFADTGLLPAIAQRADKLCSVCLGYGIGIKFVEVDKSILGVRVQFDEKTPDVLRLMCIYDVILELIQSMPGQEQISLDELLYD